MGIFYFHLARTSELDSIEVNLELPQFHRVERLPALWIKDERIH